MRNGSASETAVVSSIELCFCRTEFPSQTVFTECRAKIFNNCCGLVVWDFRNCNECARCWRRNDDGHGEPNALGFNGTCSCRGRWDAECARHGYGRGRVSRVFNISDECAQRSGECARQKKVGQDGQITKCALYGDEWARLLGRRVGTVGDRVLSEEGECSRAVCSCLDELRISGCKSRGGPLYTRFLPSSAVLDNSRRPYFLVKNFGVVVGVDR